MQHFPTIAPSRFLYVLAAVFLMVAAQSCRKDTAEISYVRIFNLVEDTTDKVDILHNDELLVGNIQYGFASGYEKAPSGSRRFSVQVGATTSSDSALSVAANVYYSLICYDSLNSIHYNLIRDELTEPAAGKSNVRFFHLNKALGAADIYLGNTLLFQSRTYNDQLSAVARQQFAAIDSGRYDIVIRAAGTSTTLYTIPGVPFAEGSTYTVMTYRDMNGGFKAAVYGH